MKFNFFKKNKMDEAYSMFGGEKKYIQGFGGKTLGKETTKEIQA